MENNKQWPQIPPTSGSNIDKLVTQDSLKESYLYLKGFYDATHQFMQTFEKLIEAGAFSGTKFNSNN